MTQTYYTKDIDGEYSVAHPQPTLREMEPEDIDDSMSVAERAVRIVLAKAKGVCLSKVHAIDHAGNSYLREASATQCANAIGALNIQPLIDQVHGILSLPTQPEPPADVARDIRLQVESEFAALLPGVTYMDEPDGGSPTVQEQVKRMVRDAERLRQFEKWANAGYAPCLAYDDDGHWQISFDGFNAVGEAIGCVTIFTEKDDWHDSVGEAIDAAIERQGGE